MLQMSSVIGAMAGRHRSSLEDRSTWRRLDPGEYLLVAGEANPRVYVVVQGIIKLVAADSAGNVSVVGLATEGDLVGEIAALDGLPQPLDAIAVSECSVAGVSAARFRAGVARDARAAEATTELLAARVRMAYDMIVERTSQASSARLASRLLDLADVLGRFRNGTIEIDSPLSQQDIGSLAGISRESASRELARLGRDGVVSYERRRLRIHRPDVLERLRCRAVR